MSQTFKMTSTNELGSLRLCREGWVGWLIMLLVFVCTKAESETLQRLPEGAATAHYQKVNNALWFRDNNASVSSTDSCKLESWNEREKIEIAALLSRIRSTYPDLLDEYDSGSRLELYRTHSIPIPSEGENIIAATSAEGITLTDKFFSLSHKAQAGTLIHELIHVGDLGGLVCYSNEWVKIAGPELRHFSKHPKSEFALTTFLASNRLVEALAESIERYSNNDRTPINRLAMSLYNGYGLKRRAFTKLFKDGVVASRQQDYPRAIKSFRSAIDIAPEAPLPHLYLCLCYSNVQSFQAAETEAKALVRSWVVLGSPITETVVSQSLKVCQLVTRINTIFMVHALAKSSVVISTHQQVDLFVVGKATQLVGVDVIDCYWDSKISDFTCSG